jgi:uncharacterized protein DUF1264
VRFVVIFGSQETNKVSNHLLSVLNVKAQTGTSFKERDNDRLIESEHTYACIYHSKNATLIGVEYIITADQYNSLPNREKPYWHYHKIEFASDRADPMFPELPAVQAKALMGKLSDTYGKILITWNPKYTLLTFPPQVEQVQHPFMINTTQLLIFTPEALTKP